MIKNAMIGMLSIVSIFFVVYANLKANEAEKQRQIAQEQEKAAIEAAAEARRQAAEATHSEALRLVAENQLQAVIDITNNEELVRSNISLRAQLERTWDERDDLRRIANEARDEASRQRVIAEENHIEAMRQSKKANDQIEKLKKELEACQNQ
jgi:CHAT domain-containing protein